MGRLIGQWTPLCRHIPATLNMLGKTHWPMETTADMSQLQHAEEDSLASGDTADIFQLHVEEDGGKTH